MRVSPPAFLYVTAVKPCICNIFKNLEKTLKFAKKVLDKTLGGCYYIQALPDGGAKV